MKTIGRYTILGLLGKGGMGKVFKIAYPVTGKIAALKLLDPNPFLLSLMGKTDIEAMFEKEAVTMARIRHPNIVDILDFDTWNTKLFYIMSFYCNNLGLMIGEGYEPHHPSRIIPFEKAIAYTVDTLKGLSCLHDGDIIHRDIKPFNLLVTDFDRVKICDFGLSRLRGEVGKDPRGLKIGSPFYAAPEQESYPDRADRRSDLYSVGVMLYRMITGTLPDASPKPPSSFNPDLDRAWDAWFLKAIRKSPDDRYTCAEAFIAAMERVRQSWLQKKENICAAPAALFDDTDHLKPLPATPLRSWPLKINKSAAAAQFNVDPLMRPNHYAAGCFVHESPSVVRDETTGLLWQIGGSAFPMKWQDAHDYIHRLNKERLHGRSDWRLPTMDELLTILSPLPQGAAHCLDPVFDQARKWLWSADRCTFISAWYLSLDLGFIAANDMSSYYYVKGVCSG